VQSKSYADVGIKVLAKLEKDHENFMSELVIDKSTGDIKPEINIKAYTKFIDAAISDIRTKNTPLIPCVNAILRDLNILKGTIKDMSGNSKKIDVDIVNSVFDNYKEKAALNYFKVTSKMPSIGIEPV
jgi:hypothetical protein